MNERSLFLEALDLEPADRPAFLDRACADDAGLRQRVEALLRADGGTSHFMAGPATTPHVPVSETAGARVGPYKLLQQIGEGGMGVVFMADQEEPVRRRVAVKIIKPGMDSKQVVARFEAERQALSMMDHPNIAKVLDAGATPSGRPYFVMELVHGVPIVEFCDANKLATRERLALFVSVCQAIQHAHTKGIIHRDIKPSNVLVTMYDDKPVAKVIDFGVAKAVEQRLTEKTMFTQYGTLVGTFEYMSPEQAEMNALGVDTRSDVYSLGVLLYELLTGTTPLDRQRLRSAALDEVIRLIKEEEPPRPSLRLSGSGLLPKLAERRRTEPGKLSASLRGELDWIVMRCLEKDRTRRYETALGLGRDVERHLNGDAVEACPPTLGYRVRKVYRRNKAAVLVATAFVGLVAASAVATGVLAVQATRAEREAVSERRRAEDGEAEAKDQRDRAEAERNRAEDEKRAAEAVRTFLQDDLLRQADVIRQAESLSPVGGDFEIRPNPTIRDLLDRAAAQLTPERIEKKFPGMPFVQAEVLHAVAAAYGSSVEDERGRPLIDRAVELYRQVRGDDDPTTLRARKTQLQLSLALPADRYDAMLADLVRDAARVFGPRDRMVLEGRLEQAGRPIARKRPADAIAPLTALREEFTDLLGPTDTLTLVCGAALAAAYVEDRQFEAGVGVMENLRNTIKGMAIRFDHPLLEAGYVALAEIYRMKGDIPKTIEVYEEILDGWKRRGQPYNPATWRTRHLLAWVYVRNRNIPKGAELFEANVSAAPDSFNAYLSWDALREAEAKLGRDDKTLIARARQGLAAAIGNKGADHKSWVTGHARIRLGQQLLRTKEHAEAEAMLVAGLREMIDEYAHVRDYSLNAIPEGQRSLLDLYSETGRAANGMKVLAGIWAGLEKLGGAARKSGYNSRHNLAWQIILESPTEAAELFEANVRAADPGEQRCKALYGLHHAELRLDRTDAALGHAREALDALVSVRGPANRDFLTGQMRAAVGLVLLKQDKRDEAEPFLAAGCREIADHIEQVPHFEYPHISSAFEKLADLHRDANRREKADEWLAVKKDTFDRLMARNVTAGKLTLDGVKLLDSVVMDHVVHGRHHDALATYLDAGAKHPPADGEATTEWERLCGTVVDRYRSTQQPDRIKPWAELRLPVLEREQDAVRHSKPNDRVFLRATNALAVGYLEAGRMQDAVKLVEEVIVRFQLSGESADLDAVEAFGRLAGTAATAGRTDRGVTLTGLVHGVVMKASAAPRVMAAATFHLGQARWKAGSHAEAETHFRAAVRLQTEADAKHWSLTKYQSWVGIALCDQKKYDSAEPILTAAHAELLARLPDAPVGEKENPNMIAARLAELYAATDRPDEAAKWKARSTAK